MCVKEREGLIANLSKPQLRSQLLQLKQVLSFALLKLPCRRKKTNNFLYMYGPRLNRGKVKMEGLRGIGASSTGSAGKFPGMEALGPLPSIPGVDSEDMKKQAEQVNGKHAKSLQLVVWQLCVIGKRNARVAQ